MLLHRPQIAKAFVKQADKNDNRVSGQPQKQNDSR